MSFVYINGKFYTEDEAKISVLDHGFLYGDGIFESLRVSQGWIFRLDDHISRLYKSAKVIGLKIPMTEDEMRKAIIETVEKNGLADAYVRVVVSRGKGYPLLDPRLCQEPTVVILVHEPIVMPQAGAEPEEKGVSVIISRTRKTPPICIEPRVKSLNYLNHILARLEAIEAGANEAIMLDMDGFITEGTGDNIFIAASGVLYTPFVNSILEGITRKTIMEMAEKEGYKVIERNLTRYDLYTADEIFLTSTAGGLLPVVKIDGRDVGTGKPGPIVKKLIKLYKEALVEKGTPTKLTQKG